MKSRFPRGYPHASFPVVLPDGVRSEDLQAAIQAAWLAGDFVLVREFARRYDLYNGICLRCVVKHAQSIMIGPSPSMERRLGDMYWQLCHECWWAETQLDRAAKALSSVLKSR